MAIILLTGAIQPAAVPLVLRDARERLLDSLCAIRCWLGEPDVARVVYFDGSGVRIPDGLFDDRFLALADDFGAAAREHGKGRADALIVTAAAASGVLGEEFYKATGRLYVENFAAIDAALDRTRDICAVPGTIRVPTRIRRIRRSLRAIETTFFWARTAFVLERLAPLTDAIDDASETTYIETVYARAVRRAQAATMTPRPVLVGRSASRGRPYHRDYDEETRRAVAPLVERITF